MPPLHTHETHDTINNDMDWNQLIIVYILAAWTLLWKGLALWKAAHANQRNWFIVILILNTIGILELVYLFRFAKKRLTLAQIRQWFISTFTTKEKSK